MVAIVTLIGLLHVSASAASTSEAQHRIQVHSLRTENLKLRLCASVPMTHEAWAGSSWASTCSPTRDAGRSELVLAVHGFVMEIVSQRAPPHGRAFPIPNPLILSEMQKLMPNRVSRVEAGEDAAEDTFRLVEGALAALGWEAEVRCLCNSLHPCHTASRGRQWSGYFRTCAVHVRSGPAVAPETQPVASLPLRSATPPDSQICYFRTCAV